MCLKVNIGKLELENPVMPASGTFGYGKEYLNFFDINCLGAIVTKGLSLYPKKGNIPPRIFEGKRYLINSIGLENIGIDKFIDEYIPFYEKLKCKIIVNFFGNMEDEYYQIAEKLNEIKVIDALEVNVSCPNVKKGAIEFGTDLKILHKIIKNLRKIADKKVLIVKISPMLADVVEAGYVIESAGADAITAINTIKGIAIDIINFRYSLGNIAGGISGELLKPVALRIIKELSENIKIPVIGVGGISTLEDVLEFLVAGASAVQVGTANFSNPTVMQDLINELKDFFEKNNFSSVDSFKKSFERNRRVC